MRVIALSRRRVRRGSGRRSGWVRTAAPLVTGALALSLAVACSSGNNNNTKTTNNAPSVATTVASSVGTQSTARPSSPTAAAITTARPATAAVGTPSAGVSGTARPGTAAAGATLPTVNITTKEFSFDAPDTVASGLTRLHMQNTGKEDHQAQLLKLNTGVTMQQLQAALQNPNPAAALALVTVAGGPNTIAPGGSSDVVEDLQPGQYVFVCFVSGDDNIPHLAKGMVKPLQVTGGSPTAAAQLPAAQITVTGREFSFDAPQTIPAGPAVVRFNNAGGQPHEMTVVKLNGITADQFKSLIANPNATPPPGAAGAAPPIVSSGGMGAIAPGASGEAVLALTPGNYAFVCFVPDPSSGKPHAELGMVQPFTVR